LCASKWLHAQANGTPTSAAHTQIDTDAVLPYYAWLAKTAAFLENHCSGFGTNSTPNHLLIIGGQSPTLRNPPRNQADPVWDMPSLPGHAADHGLSWKAEPVAEVAPDPLLQFGFLHQTCFPSPPKCRNSSKLSSRRNGDLQVLNEGSRLASHRLVQILSSGACACDLPAASVWP